MTIRSQKFFMGRRRKTHVRWHSDSTWHPPSHGFPSSNDLRCTNSSLLTSMAGSAWECSWGDFHGFFLQGEFTTTMVRYTLQQFDIAMMLWRITILVGKRLNPNGSVSTAMWNYQRAQVYGGERSIEITKLWRTWAACTTYIWSRITMVRYIARWGQHFR